MRYSLLNSTAVTYDALWTTLQGEGYIDDVPFECIDAELIRSILNNALTTHRTTGEPCKLSSLLLAPTFGIINRHVTLIEVELLAKQAYTLHTPSGDLQFPSIRYVFNSDY